MVELWSCAVQELDDVREFLLRALPEAPPPTRRVWPLNSGCETPIWLCAGCMSQTCCTMRHRVAPAAKESAPAH